MSFALAVAGLVVFVLTLSDIGGSLLGDEGDGGLVTGRFSRAIWRRLDTSRRRGRHRPSHLVGRLIVLTIPTTWLLSMWIAWTLVFSSGAGNVVASSDQTPASATEKVYYVGYMLSTLGNGEYQPTGTTWRWISVVASVSGFAVLTLGVTFVVPVVQAATARRRTAAIIALHGSTIDELRASLRSGSVDTDEVAQEIATLTEKHGAFPVLHYLHTHESTRSAPAMIAQLALARETVETSAVLDRALEGYLEFHPSVRGADVRSTWSTCCAATAATWTTNTDTPENSGGTSNRFRGRYEWPHRRSPERAVRQPRLRWWPCRSRRCR